MTSKNIKIAEMATEKSEEVNEMTNETHPELDELDLRGCLKIQFISTIG
jgi:hypothetical protein